MKHLRAVKHQLPEIHMECGTGPVEYFAAKLASTLINSLRANLYGNATGGLKKRTKSIKGSGNGSTN
jgi:hypothetical protein